MTNPKMLPLDTALQQAVAYHQAGQLQEAENLYRAILQAQPNQPAANHNLGVLVGQIGQPVAGLAYLKTAYLANTNQELFALSYAEALLVNSQVEEARKILQSAQKRGIKSAALQALMKRAEAGVTGGAEQGNEPMSAEMHELASLFNGNRHEKVEEMARLLIERYPNSGFVWKVLGASLMGQGKDALTTLRKAAELIPDDAFVHYNLGIVLKDLGRSGDAVVSYQRALEIKPDFAEAHSNLGTSLQDLGQVDRALASYRRAIEIKPDFAVAHNNLGNVLKDLGRFEDAATGYRRAIEIKPDFAVAHNNLGNALKDLGRLEDAATSYRRAIGIKPDFAVAHNNLGNVLKDLGQLEEAAPNYRRAIAIEPDFAVAYNNLGNVLQECGQLEEAVASYRRALEIKPDYVEARFGLGVSLLMMGRYAAGWHEFECRWEGSERKVHRPDTHLARWVGQQHAKADRLLVIEEQGWGDKLQFSRYLQPAMDSFPGGGSLVIGSPLLKLFRRSFPYLEIVDAIPVDQMRGQWHCPLLSLPLALGSTLETIPNQVPYLIPSPERVAYWQSRIAELELSASRRKIGVVWKTGTYNQNASGRSLVLRQLEPLLSLPGVIWFNLQKEPDPDKEEWVVSGKLIDWTEEFTDFDETAAMAMNLDLIISVDTAVVHLAGGLGRPTWLFNRHVSEWRWMRDREDSPWYPTVRIFTQKKAGDWGEVVERMVNELGGLHGKS